jgi:arylsulfatase A-like enzyme
MANKLIFLLGSCFLLYGHSVFFPSDTADPAPPPHILWLTVEDISPDAFGCYGNGVVSTPNIDSLARHGVRFTNFSATSPYCSPARSTIISGQFATTFGTDWHRQGRRVPDSLYFFPRLLREAGYFTTNVGKEDYNITPAQWAGVRDRVWDESTPGASYNSTKRADNQPFFSVFNNLITHMSRLRSVTTELRDGRSIDPASVNLPPHVPDHPVVRDDLAWHYEKAEQADAWVGKFLADLRDKNLDQRTIIFFFADHGGCLPRGKAFPYETGLRTPLIVYAPPAYRHLLPSNTKVGGIDDRLVDFTDLAPTVLHLADARVPEYLPGAPFLGSGPLPEKDIQFGFRCNTAHHYDPSRTAYDGRYKYIRFFTPYRYEGLRQDYQWGMPANLTMDSLMLSASLPPEQARHFLPHPTELLFDLLEDPWELNNIANDPSYRDKVSELRERVRRNAIRHQDLGFFPDKFRHRSDSLSLYEWVRRKDYPVDDLIAAAYRASSPSRADTSEFLRLLGSTDPAFQFWGASGLARLAQKDSLHHLPATVFPSRHGDERTRATLALAAAYGPDIEAGLATLKEMISENSLIALSQVESLGPKALPLEDAVRLKAYAGIDPLLSFYARSALISMGRLPIGKLYSAEQRREIAKGYTALQNTTGPLP